VTKKDFGAAGTGDVERIWRVTGTFFQKTFFGTARSPLSLTSYVNSCQLLLTPRPIRNKDLIQAIYKYYSATFSVLQS
jgi:hypothetical protein